METERQLLENKDQTSKEMYHIIDTYYKDLLYVNTISRQAEPLPIVYLDLDQYFDVVKNIPYRKDLKPVEIIARPYYLFKYKSHGLDCKKKSILIASFLKYWKIPYRLMGTSIREDGKIHHVFPQAFIQNEWKNFDATYSEYKPGQTKKVTNFEILKK